MSDNAKRAANGRDRRAFLSLMGAGALAAPFLARPAHAAGEDKLLQALIDQTQNRALGEDFDSASRTIHMPKASLPTLSADTAATTEQAVGQYEGILARGGWPKVTPVERLRLGESVPGFGHPLYPEGDPRAARLLELCPKNAARARCWAAAAGSSNSPPNCPRSASPCRTVTCACRRARTAAR